MPATEPRSSASLTSNPSSIRSCGSARTRSGVSTAPPGGTHRGFEHLEFATHTSVGPLHYALWLAAEHPEVVGEFYNVLDGSLQVNAAGDGDTGAPQVHVNAVPREWYHTDWVADRTIAWLDSLAADDDWFCWMSFPDPHHPWDPPQSEVGRVDWREVPLPAGYPDDAQQRQEIIDDKPRHWRLWYDGELVSNYEAPAEWVPATMTADQVREVNARNAVECELVDEAIGRVLARIGEKGWSDDVDVIFSTDHGELQGDFGLLFKGPVPRRRADAAAAHVAPRSCGTDRSGGRDPAGRARRPGPDVLLHRGHGRPGVDAGPRAAGRRPRRGRARLRAGADRVGQRALRCGRAPAHDHARRVGVHRVPTRHGARRVRRRAVRTRRRSVAAREPVERSRRVGRRATTWWPTSGTASRLPTSRASNSKRPCDRDPPPICERPVAPVSRAARS